MGPPPSATSNVVVNTSSQKHQRQRSNDIRNGIRKEPNLGMSPVSRYNHNLKVLRRRDPSIISIFDQFSHVCVYHYNGNKWEKQGFEGSMFLYERDSYPPYGFYILNRMGMDDYIQRLYPEDDVSAHGSYLMLRSYPDFTAQRLAAVRIASPNSSQVLHKFSDAYALPSPEKLQEERKGRSQTVGLWMFATDAREPLIDVMLRLHSYIEKNLPYPEDYRYGPDRPPPPNPNARNGTPSPSKDDQSRSSTLASPSSLDLHATSELLPNRPMDTPSELDILFSKLDSTTASTTPGRSPEQIKISSAPTMNLPNRPPKVTVQTLLGQLAATEPVLAYEIDDASPKHQVPVSNRGLSLLDKIFASATPSPDSSPTIGIKQVQAKSTKPFSFSATPSFSTTTFSVQTPLQHSTQGQQNLHNSTEASSPATSQSPEQQSRPHPFLLKQPSHSDISPSNLEPIHRDYPPSLIVTRNPSGTSPHTPQVLTEDVIFSLLGLGPDPKSLHSYAHTRSASTSTTSSRLSRYSGDAEDEDEGGHADSDAYSGFSHPSTVFDNDADIYEESPPADVPEAQPLRGCQPQFGAPAAAALKVNGDVTPRAPWRRSSLSGGDTLHDDVPERVRLLDHSDTIKTSSSPLAGGIPTNPPSITPATTAPPLAVNLSSSTDTVRSSGANNLAHPSTSTVSNHSRLPSGSGVSVTKTELWPDSRVPIDDRVFDDDADIVELDFADTSALSDADVFMSMIQQKERTRKAAAGLAISGSRDHSSQPVVKELDRSQELGSERPQTNIASSRPATYSSSSEVGAKNSSGPLLNHSVNAGGGGDSHKTAPVNPGSPVTKRSNHATANGKRVVAANGRVTVNGQGVQVDRYAVQQSILAATSPGRLPTVSERNEFVRELLTLVHTDKGFVDELWREYNTRVQK